MNISILRRTFLKFLGMSAGAIALDPKKALPVAGVESAPAPVAAPSWTGERCDIEVGALSTIATYKIQPHTNGRELKVERIGPLKTFIAPRMPPEVNYSDE